MKVKQAVILVGGKGTRMRPLTDNCPKPLLPVLDKPCVCYLMDWFIDAGIKEIIFACGYKPETIEKIIGDGSDRGVKITYSYEDKPLGSGGAVKLIEDKLDDTFLMMNGDVFYTEFNVKKQVDEHFASGAAATISLASVEDPTQYGIVRMDSKGNITEFKDKPKPEEVFSNDINAGVYVLNKEILKFIEKDMFCDMSKEVFPLLIEKGYVLHGTRIDGEFIDVGRPQNLYDVNMIMAKKLYGKSEYLGEGTKVLDSKIENSAIHKESVILNSTIVNSLILEKCIVNGMTINNSIVRNNKGFSEIININENEHT